MVREQPDERKLLLLLTATIDPKGMILTGRQSPTARLRDYERAVASWCRHRNVFRAIVMCENSGYPLPEGFGRRGADQDSPDVVLLQFDGNNYPRCRGKGYGEAQAIRYVMQNLHGVESYDYVVKCTGRYYVPNISGVLKALDRRPDIVCSMSKDLRAADSRLFVIRPRIARVMFEDFAAGVNDSANVFFEHVLAKWVSRLASKGYCYSPWAVLPYYVGFSGTTNQRLDSVPGRLRHLMKNMLYKVSKLYAEI